MYLAPSLSTETPEEVGPEPEEVGPEPTAVEDKPPEGVCVCVCVCVCVHVGGDVRVDHIE